MKRRSQPLVLARMWQARPARQGLGRFPPPAVVVLTDDTFAVSGDAAHAVIIVAAEFTGFVAGSFVADRVARGGRRCRRRRSR